MVKNEKIDAIVCPKQKIVKIIIPGKKGKHTVLHKYRFKQDIPFIDRIETKTGYNHRIWCVSDRDYEYNVTIREYDQHTMNEIRRKTLELYLNATTQP